MVFFTRNGSSGDTAKINRRYWAENAFKPPGEFVACAAALRKINRTQVQALMFVTPPLQGLR